MNQFECSSEIQNNMNKKIYDRNIPSNLLQPYIDVRPVSTKYSFLPIVDPRAPINVPAEQYPIYNSNYIFYPGNNMAPFSGYMQNVNVESELRNQIYALQKCPQAEYVPSSKSDLYHYNMVLNSNLTQKNAVQQSFPYLFNETHFSDFNPNKDNLAKNTFNNCTRVEIRSMNTPCV
jgi:hypothetical protein